MQQHTVQAAIVLAVAVAALLLAGCDSLESADANVPPNTVLANVPQAGDTLFALQTLHWDGRDTDGFADRYEWRNTTLRHTGSSDATECEVSMVRRVAPDSTVQVDTVLTYTGWEVASETGWTETKETRQTLAFDSENDYNLQLFEVRAIDDASEPDPSPAQKCFFTRKTFPPESAFVTPQGDSSLFVTPDGTVTDWWHGIAIAFTAVDGDPEGEIEAYAWAVGDGDWQWTEDTTAVITPDHFDPLPTPGDPRTYVVRVTARDNTNIVGPPDSVEVTLVRPSHERDLLIIDETLEEEEPFSQLGIDDATVDAFYGDIFDVPEGDWWDYHARGMPSHEVLGRYRSVLWHADNNYVNAVNAHRLPNHVGLISDYMNTGGDFVMSGWRILHSFRPDTSWQDNPQTFDPGSFVFDYLHIVEVQETLRPQFSGGDFRGVDGVAIGYHDARVDSARLASIRKYQGFPAEINLILDRGGFTEVIYTYQTRGDRADYDGQPVGVRYTGTSFNAVVLGFPVYFLQQEDARTLGRDILQDLGY